MGLKKPVIKSALGIEFASNSTFSAKNITKRDRAGNYYVVESNSPRSGSIYDKNMNLLKAFTNFYPLTTVGEKYYTASDSGTGVGGVNLYNHDGTLIKNVQSSSLRTAPCAIRENQIAYDYYTGTQYYRRIIDFNGTVLNSVNKVGASIGFTVNVNDNFVHLTQSTLFAQKVDKDFNESVIRPGVVDQMLSFDFLNW